MTEKKNKFDGAVLFVLMIALGCVGLTIGGLIIIGQNLFMENPPITMFEGIVYGSLGLIIGGMLALMIAYQKTIEQMNAIIEVNKESNQFAANPTMFMGGLPTDLTPEQLTEYRRNVMKNYMGVKEDYHQKISSMTDEQLEVELKIQEDKEDFEKAAQVRDEINKRKAK